MFKVIVVGTDGSGTATGAVKTRRSWRRSSARSCIW